MSHLVEQMAYVGQTPWHGLGNALQHHQPLSVWQQQAGMDWEILSSPVQFIAARPNQKVGAWAQFDDSKVLYRSDTLAPLSVVSQRYQVVQPKEILEFYRDLTEYAGFELETAGVLKGGKKFWALAKTGQAFQLKGGDRTEGYLLLATACDGTLATTAQFTSIRVVCNNTLAIALGDNQGCVKVPHSTKFEAEKVKTQLGISTASWGLFHDYMRELSQRNVSDKEVARFYQQVFGKSVLHTAGMDQQTESKATERTMAQCLALFQGQGRGSQLPSANGTAFGLLNSVTEFIDHQRRARSVDNRLDSAWFGTGAQTKQHALATALDLVA